MELLTLKVKPLSTFVTIPKGDTIFGHILAYLYSNKEGKGYFKDYLTNKPKLIVSDMMPFGYVYKPNLPLDCFKSSNLDDVDKKELRKRNFISLENLQDGNLHLCEKIKFSNTFATIKNSIHRNTFTTGIENFAPYGIEETIYFTNLWMFILVDNDIKDLILKTVSKIGKFGFGKYASVGKGSFEIELINTPVKDIDSNYSISISPTILKDKNIEMSWYEPFTRFGKYGLHNAHTNAFKKPSLMADSGAVVKLKEKTRYFGSCLNNGIDEKLSFLQGYSISIPFKIKDEKCLNLK